MIIIAKLQVQFAKANLFIVVDNLAKCFSVEYVRLWNAEDTMYDKLLLVLKYLDVLLIFFI